MSDKEFITVQELEEFLPVSARTLYKWFKEEECPGVQRIGHKYVIHRDTFINWFRRRGGSDDTDPLGSDE